MTREAAPPASGSQDAPLLILDRDEVRLPSPRGDTVTATLTLTNAGSTALRGNVAVRLGAAWLRVEPAALHLRPGEACVLLLRGDPSALGGENALGEIGITTNAGNLTVPVSVGMRVRPVALALLPTLVVAAALIAVTVAIVVLGGRATPAPPRPAARHGATHRHGAIASHAPQAVSAAVAGHAVVAAIQRAVANSDAVWQAALMTPSTAALSSVKTGADLSRTVAEVQQLVASGDQWEIQPRSFRIEPNSVSVAAGSTSGSAIADKTERRALYGAGAAHRPYEASTAAYRLRYHLVYQGAHWLVDDVTVLNVTPLDTAPVLSRVEQVVARVLPTVIHVEATSAGQDAVGTGIVVQSSSTGSDIVTNDHVVKGATLVQLSRWLDSGMSPATPWTATGVREDPANDLAIIHITKGGLPVATWGDAGALQPAQEVVAIGYAENFSGGPTITTGIVSSVRRSAPDDPNGPSYIQHSATINHGNSGGPLIDMSGHIVGINTWTLEGTQGLFFAIPSVRAATVVAGFIGSNG